MFAIAPPAWIATVALGLVLLSLLLWRSALRAGTAKTPRDRREALDTMLAWPPEAARVMTSAERRGYDTLTRAMPEHLVLAQVPLSRFLRVPKRHSYTEWLQRVGFVNADLVLCDKTSKVLAVVDIRSVQESERARRRHDRIGQVLRTAGIHVLVWAEDDMPSVSALRSHLLATLEGAGGAASMPAQPINSKPLPLIPVAEIEEFLADGDAAMAAQDASMEPVPSTFFADLEPITVNDGRR